MKKTIFFSTSAGDIAHVVDEICSSENRHEKFIVYVIDNLMCFDFFKSLNLHRTEILLLILEQHPSPPFSALQRGFHLYKTKKKLMDFAVQIIHSNIKTVKFFNVESKFVGFLLRQLPDEIEKVYVDAHHFDRNRLNVWDILRSKKIKTVLEFAYFQLFYTNIFFLSNNYFYPQIAFDIRKVNAVESRIANKKLSLPRIKIQNVESGISESPYALYLFDIPYGEKTVKQETIQYKICEMIEDCGFNLVIKAHPQQVLPKKFSRWILVDKYIPFEFLDLKPINLIIGIGGNVFNSCQNVTLMTVIHIVSPASPEIKFLERRIRDIRNDVIFLQDFKNLKEQLSLSLKTIKPN